ncbi:MULTISPECIES: hypothetical protein [unclassified Facklamia]|uniref:hypothetical protein n=1 Tax=Aerococcaceae TaxID=186827 RepID=UPI0013B72082|nr:MULTISPECIES: hypothetical protein [unclassified Facklamia]NEW65303.1 hypothetical protein [Facklamia sp. 252]NEW68797.1 hypothetical protein [Facklamia sp. 253]QQD66108.1 hypothetical protein JDW14_03095 [Aerococcaceae bacterium zg-252]
MRDWILTILCGLLLGCAVGAVIENHRQVEQERFWEQHRKSTMDRRICKMIYGEDECK